MNEQEFTYVREMLLKRSGLSLTVDKRYLVDSRLAAVCRQMGLRNLSELIQGARAGNEVQAVAIVEAMTTNETLFFRDITPFKHLRELILPALHAARSSERTIRIWCAAASSGQEPYSLAMVLDEMAGQFAGWRIEILATDISTEILEKARIGVYSQFEVQRGLPIQLLMKHFTQEGDRWRLSERIRKMVTFKQHNLIGQASALGTFDIVLCRNVLIYFDAPTKTQVFGMLAKSLRSDGYLMLGAAETVMGLTDLFTADRENRGVCRLKGTASAAQARPAPARAGPVIAAPAPASTLRPLPSTRDALNISCGI